MKVEVDMKQFIVKISQDYKLITGMLLVAFTLLIAFVIMASSQNSDNNKLWDITSNKSEFHAILVPEYRRCRSGFLGEGKASCSLLIADYAKLRDIPGDLNVVFDDLDSLEKQLYR